MKRFISAVAIAFSLVAVMVMPAYAADAAAGGKVFTANCAACHAGGNNLVISTKNLRKDTLESYDMYSAEAIEHQVINGKNAMPAFSGRLSDEQIENVAAYVMQQAEKGW